MHGIHIMIGVTLKWAAVSSLADFVCFNYIFPKAGIYHVSKSVLYCFERRYMGIVVCTEHSYLPLLRHFL